MVKPIGGSEGPRFPDRPDTVKKIEKPAKPAEVGARPPEGYVPKTRAEQIEAVEQALLGLQPRLMVMGTLSDEDRTELLARKANLESALTKLREQEAE